MRKLIKKAAGWVHATLIMALLVPLFYALGTSGENSVGGALYLRCLLIVLPVIVTDIAIEKCRYLILYLFICILTLAATAALGWRLSLTFSQKLLRWGYFIILLCETFFVMIDRLIGRLHKKEKKEMTIGEMDPYWQPAYDILKEPSFPALIYFGLVYFVALNINNPGVCNAALISAVIYAFVTFLYQYVIKTETYLLLNKRTCNLPSKRIYGIGSGMLALFLILLLFLSLPAFFTIENRHYRDLREWKPEIEIDFEAEQMSEYHAEGGGEDPMAELIAEYGEIKPTPQWLVTLGYVVQGAVFLAAVIAVLRKIRNTFRDFRETNDENGDVVEELLETESGKKIAAPEKSSRKLTERERIRKQYRKVIRKNRKDRPAVYESPAEIESYAGIAQSAEGKELHRQYELARYGKDFIG